MILEKSSTKLVCGRGGRRWIRAGLSALSLGIAAGVLAPQAEAGQPATQSSPDLRLGASVAFAFEGPRPGSALARITAIQHGQAPSVDIGEGTAEQEMADQAPTRQMTNYAPLSRTSATSSLENDSRPNFFGTVALAVRATALDGQWRRVANAEAPVTGAGAQAVRLARGLPVVERLDLVNSWVNHAVAFDDDQRNYHMRDYWANASETLARGRGDCEDYAIAKMALLRAANVPAEDIYLVIAHDLVRRADHALLVVRLDGRDWVLDSNTDLVLPVDKVRDYRPVITYSAGRAWIHGYERAPKVALASTGLLYPAGGAER